MVRGQERRKLKEGHRKKGERGCEGSPDKSSNIQQLLDKHVQKKEEYGSRAQELSNAHAFLIASFSPEPRPLPPRSVCGGGSLPLPPWVSQGY